MSNSKRSFDFLSVTSFGNSSRKRAKSPASQIGEDNVPTPNPLTQPVRGPTVPPQSSSIFKEKAQAIEELGRTALSKLKKSLSILQKSCGVFEPLVTAAGTLQEVLRIIEDALPNTGDTQDRASNLGQWATLLTTFIDETQPLRMSKQMENLIGTLRREAESLKMQAEGNPYLIRQNEYEMNHLESSHKEIEEALRLLVVEASLNVWKNTDNQLKESLLSGMLPVQEALYDSSYADKIERGPCLENTRITVLDDIRSWMYNPSETKVYWISGMAGTGKTTIAYSICNELTTNKRLGASFFVSRTSSQCQDVGRMLPTIAYQLARVSYAYRCALCRILYQELSVAQRKLSVQFEYLIELPLLEAAERMPLGLVVVVDALDECSDPRTVELIINLLMKCAHKLPVRFILTSRPEPGMTEILSRDGVSQSIFYLHNVEEQLVKEDIKTFLVVQLAGLDPTNDQIEGLAEQAGVLFIYAATLVRYVLGSRSGSKTRLEGVLAPCTERVSKKDRVIDKLYQAILERVLQDEDREEHEVEVIKQVLWTVACMKEPVTTQTLAVLIEFDDDQITEALYPLQSVIHISRGGNIVSAFHASFPEFILSPLRSGPLHCNKKAHNKYLAIRCFTIMEQQLRFNICGLESSYVLDADVPNIKARTKAAISPELFYACRFWSKHLIEDTFSDGLVRLLDAFLNVRLLFWMEVLNLKRSIENGHDILMGARSWLSPERGHLLLDDALEFLDAFAGNSPVNSSTPHIYVSHLPLGPKSNRVRQMYLERTHGLVRVEGTAVDPNTSEDSTVIKPHHASLISYITFSPDSSMMATVSDDGAIYVWNSFIGSAISGPFQPRKGQVTMVAFSFNGFSLASAYPGDNKIRIWRTYNDQVPPDPIINTDLVFVSELCFSSDNARIAFTGSYQYAGLMNHIPPITVVDAHTGNVLHILCRDRVTGIWRDLDTTNPHNPNIDFPLPGAAQLSWPRGLFYLYTNGFDNVLHRSFVSSPKDESIMCCAYVDKARGLDRLPLHGDIALWDSSKDILTSGPFGCGGEMITAFAFSPDGTRVVSGSKRGSDSNHTNIRTWEVCDDREPHLYWPGDAWCIDQDGWLRDQDSRPVLRIPEEWRCTFPVPPNRMTIGPVGSLRVSMENLLLGEFWAECYAPYAPTPSS